MVGAKLRVHFCLSSVLSQTIVINIIRLVIPQFLQTMWGDTNATVVIFLKIINWYIFNWINFQNIGHILDRLWTQGEYCPSWKCCRGHFWLSWWYEGLLAFREWRSGMWNVWQCLGQSIQPKIVLPHMPVLFHWRTLAEQCSSQPLRWCPLVPIYWYWPSCPVTPTLYKGWSVTDW